MHGLYGLRCIQNPSDIRPVANKVIQRALKLRDDLLKSEENLPDILDDISYTICSLVDPLQCAQSTHWNPRYKEAALESILLIQPLMLQLNTDIDVANYLVKTMKRFKFHGEELAILKSSLAEYQTFGIGLSSIGSVSKLHSKIQMISNEYDGNRRNLNRSEKQAMLIELTKTRWKLARTLGYSSYSGFFLKDKLLDNPETVRKFLLARCKESQTSLDFEFPNAFVKSTGLKWNSLYSICQQVLSFAKYFYGIESSISSGEFPNSFMKIIMCDTETGKYLGTIYADLKVRSDKCIEPSHFTILGSKKLVKNCLVTGISNFYQRPIVYISSNIQDPLELSFDEIASIFHEFGHAFHGNR